jgi:hypothetical protein
MQTVNARTVLAMLPEAPVTVWYREHGLADAHASFASLAITLQALCYDSHIENVLAVIVRAPDGPLPLPRPEIDALMEALRQPAGVGAVDEEYLFDMESLVDHLEACAGTLEFSGLGRAVAIPLDGRDPA